MEKAAAVKIIQQLADGIDPQTGKTFHADSPYQQPDTVRALFMALQALDERPAAKARPAANENAPQNRASHGRMKKIMRSPPHSMRARRFRSWRPVISARVSRSRRVSASLEKLSRLPICAATKRLPIPPLIQHSTEQGQTRGRLRKGSFPPVSCAAETTSLNFLERPRWKI